MDGSSDWRAEVLSLISGESIDDVDPAEARRIILENLPVAIYKYRAVNGNSIQNLRDNTVWMASPNEVNDPFDTVHTLDPSELVSDKIRESFGWDSVFTRVPGLVNSSSIGKVKQAQDPLKTITELVYGIFPRTKASQGVRKYVEAFSYAVNRQLERMREWSRDSLRDGVKLCSFSEVSDEVLMWSHYTKDHSGFCIEWDMSLDQNRSELANLLYPVVYTDELLDTTKHLTATVNGKQPNPLLAVAAGIRKSRKWSYEKEWRLLFPIGPETPSYNFQMPKPSKVIFGAKMRTADRELIGSICKDQGITTTQIRFSTTEYSLREES